MGVGQNPVPPMTLKSLLKGGNHPQKGTLGFDPPPYLLDLFWGEGYPPRLLLGGFPEKPGGFLPFKETP